jgi:enoyl reductase-like protein
MDRVVHAVGGLIDPDVARWLAEETLWQTAALLADAGRVALPEVGTLERVDGPAGPALRAVASPALRRAGGAR